MSRGCVSVVCACVVLTGFALPAAARDKGVAPAGYQLLSLGDQYTKWGAALPGTGAVVHYAFVTSSTNRPGARNCRVLEPFAATLPRSKLRADDFRREIRRALKSWERVANIRFVPAAAGARADLVIGLQRRGHGIAYADVERDPVRSRGFATIRQAAICFNPRRAWEAGFDGDPATPDVRYVAAHEIGHVIGLDHSWSRHEARLMDFRNRELVRTPQRGDIAGAVLLYGKPHTILPGDDAKPERGKAAARGDRLPFPPRLPAKRHDPTSGPSRKPAST